MTTLQSLEYSHEAYITMIMCNDCGGRAHLTSLFHSTCSQNMNEVRTFDCEKCRKPIILEI